MGLTISQIRRSLRLLPISQEPPSPETAASGRRSHRRTGWTLWRDRRPDAFHMGRRAPVHDQATPTGKRADLVEAPRRLSACRVVSRMGTKGAEAVSELVEGVETIEQGRVDEPAQTLTHKERLRIAKTPRSGYASGRD